MSKLRIQQRGPVEGVACDVVCIGVNYDFMERRDGRWGLVLRQPVYERDFIDPVDPQSPNPATFAGTNPSFTVLHANTARSYCPGGSESTTIP